MNRHEIEDFRTYAATYHAPLHWKDAIRLCDVILGREPLTDEPRPVLQPYFQAAEGAKSDE